MMNRKRGCYSLVFVSGALALGHVDRCQAQLLFSEQAIAAGLSSVWDTPTNYGMYVEMQGGATVGDFNNDGWPDLFVLSGAGNSGDHLFINNQNGTFTDQAASWGVDRWHHGSGVIAGDYNNDGWVDLFITSHGPASGQGTPGSHILYKNNGDSTFTDVAVQAGVNWASTAIDGFSPAFGDYDLDGDLDLFTTAWSNLNDGNRLFQNNGDGTFTDVTQAIGLDTSGIRGFAPIFADMDGDRYPELLIAGDFGTSAYFQNNTDGTFTRLSRLATGINEDCNAMGATVADINGDGLLDWYISNIFWSGAPDECGQTLYINQGGHTFANTALAAGVIDGGWGWGTEALDVDNDADLDLVQTNGWKFYPPTDSRLFTNNGDGTFTDTAQACLFADTASGRSLLHMDYDKDGDLDIVITVNNSDTPANLLLYRNDLSGPNANYIRVNLDTSAHPCLAPSGMGAWVHITAGGTTQHRYVDGGPSFLGRGELTEHVGLGSATIVDSIQVDWPNGSSTVLTNVNANQELTIATRHPANFDGNRVLDVLDFFGFVSAFAQGDMLADLNNDQIIDVMDFFLFVNMFAAPCN